MPIRLNLTVEGQTEETFVRRVLAPYLGLLSVGAYVRCVTTRRKKGIKYRGGMIPYPRVKKEMERWMKEDRGDDARFSTMFDLYQLPTDFPGYEEASRSGDPYEKVKLLEGSLAKEMGDSRFIPYIQLHEFEALLLSDPKKLDSQFDHSNAVERITMLVSQFSSPELIDDGIETAPSKRIAAEIPAYASVKRSAGPLVAERIGLQTMRAKCCHFGEWIRKLEVLAI